MTVTRITSETTDILNEIADDVFDDAIDPAELAKLLARPEYLLFVAVEDGVVVGQCLGIVLYGADRKPALYIDNLGVAPPAQRKGIATRLMAAVTEAGRDMGATWMWLGSDPDSDSALPFYRSLGMTFRTAEFTEFELDD